MAAAPNNKKTEESGRVSEEVQRFAVRAATGGTVPGEGDEKPEYRLTSIRRSAGGQRLDVAEFEYATTEVLQDIKTPVSYRETIDVVAPLPESTDEEPDDPPPDDIIFRGEMGIPKLSLSDNGEQSVTATARLEPWHFGEPVKGYQVWIQNDSGEIIVSTLVDSVTFNPEIDGKIVGNKSTVVRLTIDVDGVGNKGDIYTTTEDLPGYDNTGYHLWRYATARRYEEDPPDDATINVWTLPEAVYSLCWMLNYDETHIKNPEFSILEAFMADAPPLRNWSVKLGTFLPAALDSLLTPFGFSWYTKHLINSDGDYVREITIFRRGEGRFSSVKLGATGSDRDLSTSNLASLECEWNIAETANIVTVYGAQKEIELTVFLQPAWAWADDALNALELEKDNPESKYEKKQFVHRKWVLNESGEYTNIRGVTGSRKNLQFYVDRIEFDGDPIWPNEKSRHRRQFYAPLTHGPDNGRREVLVEYAYDSGVYGEPLEWRNVLSLPDAQFSVLKDECGIIFTGQQPPEELVRLAQNRLLTRNAWSRPVLRVTACIRSDDRVTGQADKTEVSPNGADIRLVIDAPDRYYQKIRLLEEDSARYPYWDQADNDYTQPDTCHSRYTESTFYPDDLVPGADEQDDTDAIQTFAERTRDIEQAARVSPVIVLQGYHPEFEIGDRIIEIEGRGISFNQNAEDNDEKRYPQVMEIEYTQTNTKLTLKTFEDVVEGA